MLKRRSKRSTIAPRGASAPPSQQSRHGAMNNEPGLPRCLTAVAALTAVIAFLAPPLDAQANDTERALGCYLAGGRDAFEKGNWGLAEQEFRGALKAFPGLLEARENLAITLAREGKLDEAVAEFGGIVADRPKSPEAHFNLGLVLLDANDLSGAEQHLRKAVELNPAYPEAQNSLGLTLQRQGNREGAAEAFRAALKLDPQYVEARNN